MASQIECVPNFSEGRVHGKIRRIVDALVADPKVSLLGSDLGAGANRTVVTIAAPPGAVVDAAFRGIEAAKSCIDMRQHQGAHQRMGATDVCPFTPLTNATMEDGKNDAPSHETDSFFSVMCRGVTVYPPAWTAAHH